MASSFINAYIVANNLIVIMVLSALNIPIDYLASRLACYEIAIQVKERCNLKCLYRISGRVWFPESFPIINRV